MTRITIVLATFLITFSTYFGIRETANIVASRLNTQYSQVLTAACESAAEKMDNDDVSYAVMASEKVREDVVNTFFNTMLLSFENVTTLEEDIESEPSVNRMVMYKNIPVILLIDTNGFYVWYSTFEDDGLVGKISSMSTYSESIQEGDVYYVRYFLGNRVQVSLKTEDTVYDGKPEEVFEELGEPGALDFLATDEKYARHRNAYIANLVEKQVGYYINNENLERSWSNNNYSDYVFEMPEMSMSDWMEMVEHPSVISFYQGKEINNGSALINTYAFSASEYAPGKTYCITSDGKYHRYECEELSEDDRERTFSSRKELAKNGYEPCDECRP